MDRLVTVVLVVIIPVLVTVELAEHLRADDVKQARIEAEWDQYDADFARCRSIKLIAERLDRIEGSLNIDAPPIADCYDTLVRPTEPRPAQ